MNSTKWTRREFGKAAVAVAAATVATPYGVADATSKHGLTFVGSAAPEQPETGAIHAFRTSGPRWTALGSIPAAAPAHLVMHPNLPVLYAVHNVDTWDHLPRGAVSTYRVDLRSGQLAHLHTQPLSLSATHPRHAVLTVDASHLFVAAEGGGIYNLLPVAADGTLQPASAIRKEFGLEEDGIAKAASPNSVALLPDGSLLAADAGQEVLINLTVQNGMLLPRHRTRVHQGEGPAHLSLSSTGIYAYTTGAVRGGVRRHRLLNGKAVDEVELGHTTGSPLEPALEHVPDAMSVLTI